MISMKIIFMKTEKSKTHESHKFDFNWTQRFKYAVL